MMRKLVMFLAFLISYIPFAHAQMDPGPGNLAVLQSIAADSTTPPPIETLTILLLRPDGDYDKFEAAMPQTIEGLKDELRQMTSAFEAVSNSSLRDNIETRNQIDGILTNLTTLNKDTTILTKDITTLDPKRKAKFLNLGLGAGFQSDFTAKAYNFSLSPKLQFNLWNSFLVGIGVGLAVDTKPSLAYSIDISLGYWLF